MKIMRLCNGLGNAMFQYATYLQLCKMYPDEEIYIDSIWYDFTGYPYDLKQVFNLDLDKIDFYKKISKDREPFFDDKLEELRFWKKVGYHSVFETSEKEYSGGLSFNELPLLYNSLGENLNIVSDQKLSFDDWINLYINNEEWPIVKLRKKVKAIFGDTSTKRYLYTKTLLNKNTRKKFIHDIICGKRPDFCGAAGIDRLNHDGNVYYNIYGNYNDCIGIREELINAFRFIEFTDEKNITLASEITNCEAVAIHTRIAHFYYGMSEIMERDYFAKAVTYIKKNLTKKPRFFIFSDEIDWCKDNIKLLGLNGSDDIVFVEGNHREKSYLDMQLMSLCKHNIVPNSTFSWWAAYLNQNPDKIVITPFAKLPGTISF